MRKGKIMKKQKQIIKLSNLLLDALCELKKAKLHKIQSCFEDFCSRCSQITKDSHNFYTAVGKNWLGSAEKIKTRACRNINDFSYHFQRFKEIVNTGEIKLPKLADIFAELLQIEQEHGQLSYDLKERTVSVVTDPITMEDIPLGPFEIKLFINDIDKLYIESPYKIIALEPNPAGSDDSVTHPHVSSERLCEGDGHTAIIRAVEQGRLCDLFTMIVSILQTYNPDSPYISLDDWEGTSCYDCGCTISPDDLCYCEDCDRDYCSECSMYCEICDTTSCLGCSYKCPECEIHVCRHCTVVCCECQETFCKNCIDEEGLCQNCIERKEQENEENNQEETESTASSAVLSDSVGEDNVHA